MSLPECSHAQQPEKDSHGLANLEIICQNAIVSSNTTCANDDDIFDQLDLGVSYFCNNNQHIQEQNSNQLFFFDMKEGKSQQMEYQQQRSSINHSRRYLFQEHYLDQQNQSKDSFCSISDKKPANKKVESQFQNPAINHTIEIQLNGKKQIDISDKKYKQKKYIFNPTKNIVKTFLVSFAIFMHKNQKIVEKLITQSRVEIQRESYEQDLKYFRKNIHKNLSLSKLREILTTGVNQKLYRILTNYYLRKGFLSHLYSAKCKVLGRQGYLNHRQSLKKGFIKPLQFTQFLPFLTNISIEDEE